MRESGWCSPAVCCGAFVSKPEEKKLLLLVSDGQPAGTSGYLGSAAEADLRGIRGIYEYGNTISFSCNPGMIRKTLNGFTEMLFWIFPDLTKLPFW